MLTPELTRSLDIFQERFEALLKAERPTSAEERIRFWQRIVNLGKDLDLPKV